VNLADGTLITQDDLAEIVAKHKKWIDEKEGGCRAYLEGAYLNGAYLNGAELNCAYLRGLELRYADFEGASLRYANLGSADLRYANLGSADLRGANLGSADLRGANLKGAYLKNTYLRYANLSGADLTGACINWQSHTLVSHLLMQAAGDDIERQRWAAWIAARTDVSWGYFLWHITNEQLEWGLGVLAAYVQDGDGAPDALKARAKQAS
jgi:hypothetical protein